MINYYVGEDSPSYAEDFEKYLKQQEYNKLMNQMMQMAAMCWFLLVSFATGLVLYYEFGGY